MSRSRKRFLMGVGAGAGLVVLVPLLVLLCVDANRYKPRFEAAASDALGMEVRVAGRLHIGFSPGFRVTAEDARLVGEGGETVASAKRVDVGLELLPLLRHQVRLRTIELAQPRLSIERDPEGRLNVRRLKKALALLGDLDRATVSFTDGGLRYADRRTGQALEVPHFDLALRHVRVGAGMDSVRLNGLALDGRLACSEIRTKTFSLSALEASVAAQDGIFDVTPVALRAFGGQAAGSLRLDFSRAVPVYQVRCSLPSFRIEEFLEAFLPDQALEGTMALSANLSMQGATMSQIIATTRGEVTMHGGNLTLVGNDLDLALSRYASSQRFNLVDVGAVFLAGPLGLATSKGYNFSNLFRGTGGHTDIRVLVSNWRIERGVAQAADAALATPRYRIALQGGLDFVHGRFADMTVAVIDPGGCAGVRQAIRGPFAKPVVEKPHVLRSLAGPVVRLFKQARGLFPQGPCEVFYAGTVPAPG